MPKTNKVVWYDNNGTFTVHSVVGDVSECLFELVVHLPNPMKTNKELDLKCLDDNRDIYPSIEDVTHILSAQLLSSTLELKAKKLDIEFLKDSTDPELIPVAEELAVNISSLMRAHSAMARNVTVLLELIKEPLSPVVEE